jgi:glycerate-2-kinase
VAVGQESGQGGRNQEFVLAASARIAGSKNIVVASVDSDGTDGPTTLAGGIVDGLTIERIHASGFDVIEELRRHNSSPVLETLGDAVVLGNTGTNLRDLRVVLVGGAGPAA